VPAEQRIGRNCVIDSGMTEELYPGNTIEDGESLLSSDQS